MDINAIRAGIFFMAFLLVILYPKKVYNFQKFVVGKLHIKYNVERDRKYYLHFGIAFLIISIILFLYSITD